MKKVNVCLVILGSFMLLVSIPMFAQGDPPPPAPTCCPRGTEVAGQNQVGPLVAKGQLLMTADMLQAQGITKREFIERLSLGMFAGKSVDLILSVKSTINRPETSNPFTYALSQGLIAIQETRFYRVPLYSLDIEQIEALDEFGLTDGSVQLTVKFVKSANLE